MQVNKQVFFGEALYRLSVYEKGRCAPGKIWWTKKYVAQLVNSVNLMGEIIRSLSDESVTAQDSETVRKIVDSKEMFCFNEALLNQWQENNYTLSSIHNLSSYKEVNQLMSNIIEQLKQSVKSLNRKNKQKIWHLLQALHNLPKVYLNLRQESMFNDPAFSTTVDVAAECAQSYLKMIN